MTIDYKLLKLKRDDAINEVKRSLRHYAQLKLYPKEFVDRVKSFNSFLINIEMNDSSSYLETDLKLLKELSHEEEEQEFVRKWDYLLSCLCKTSKTVIIRVFLKEEKVTVIKDENTDVYYQLRDSYEILACLDETVDYTIEDYSQLRNYELQQQKKDTARWDIKKAVINYISKAQNGFLRDEVIQTLKQLPYDEKKALIEYIKEEKSLTSYEYRKIKRGLLLFAYYFDYIEFTYEELEDALKRTGGGWKKLMPKKEE